MTGNVHQSIALQPLADRALALDGPAPASPWLSTLRLQQWGGGDAAGVQVVIADLDGLDLLQTLEAATGHSRLLLMTEVLLQPGPDDGDGVPIRSHLLAIAERNGWQLQREQDMTAPLIDQRQALIAALERQRRPLKREGFDVAAALQDLQQRQLALRQGRRQGLTLCLVCAAPARQRTLAVQPEHAERMRALFAEVFGHPMTAGHWQWKYASGHGQAVALFEDGEMVAHYGGLTRELKVFGQAMRGCQVCDVMVATRARRSLARRGPMFCMAATFLETQIGWGLPHAIGFGFPSARHQGMADRMRLYEGVDRMVQLSWPTDAAAAAEGLRVDELHDSDAGADRQGWRQVDRLWQAMAKDLQQSVLGVRDAGWLRWRYLQRPGVDYQVLSVRSRWLRRPIGVLVLRRRDDALELLDLVARPQDFARLLALARARAADAGLPRLRCWVSASHQSLLSGDAPVQADDLAIEVPACRHTLGPEPSTLRNRWFLMAGDADFT